MSLSNVLAARPSRRAGMRRMLGSTALCGGVVALMLVFQPGQASAQVGNPGLAGGNGNPGLPGVGGAGGTGGAAGSGSGNGGAGGAGSSEGVGATAGAGPAGGGAGDIGLAAGGGGAESGGGGGSDFGNIGGAGGGGGGGGGRGAAVGGANVIVGAPVQGGTGGAGGAGTGNGASGGGGGGGGNGLVYTGTGTLTLNAAVAGGGGGTGGANNGSNGLSGGGGGGGAGLITSDVIVQINQTVAGGAGGAAGTGGGGVAGAGGVGVTGSGLTIQLGATGVITGGTGGAGGQAAAINLTGGANSLAVTAGGAINGGINIAAGSLDFAQAANLSLSNVISGAGSISKSGASTLTLTGANTYSGTTTITLGTIAANSSAALGNDSGTNTLIFNGAVAALLATGDITSTTRGVTLTSNGTIDTDTHTVSIAGVVTGAGNLTKQGSGVLTLSGTNTYSGTTTINAGTLNANSSAALGNETGTNTLIFGGVSTLRATGAITSPGTRGVTLNANATIDTNGNAVSIAGTIAGGAATLTKSGGNTLTLSGANNYDGVTTVTAGALRVTSNGGLGSTVGGTVVQSGAALELSGPIAIGAEALSLAGTGVANDGALRNIAGANSFAGAVTLAAASRINVDAGSLTLTGGLTGATFDLAVLTAAGTTMTVDTVNATGIGTLTKEGAGTLAIAAGRTLSAQVINNTAGVISVGVGSTLQGLANTMTNSATIDVATNGIVTDAGVITNTATAIINFNGPAASLATLSSTTTGSIVNNGVINVLAGVDAATLNRVQIGGNVTGLGTVNLANFSGLVSASTPQSIANTIAIGVNAAATIDNGTNALTLASPITGGAGAVANFIGTGSTTLTGSNVPTLEFLGTANVNAAGAVAATNVVVATGAVFGNSAFAGPSALPVVNVNNLGVLEVNGTVGGNVVVGTVAGNNGTLQGANTLATGVRGNVTVNDGSSFRPGDVAATAGTEAGSFFIAGNLTLAATSTTFFDLNTTQQINGTGATGNDLVTVGGTLTAGTAGVNANLTVGPAVSGYYRLFNTAAGAAAAVPNFTVTSAASTSSLYAVGDTQVNLLLRNNGGGPSLPPQLVQFWDGTDTTGATAGAGGGAGEWTGAVAAPNTNWNDTPTTGVINDQWRGEVGVFGGTGGLVTVRASAPQPDFQGLQFTVSGYEIAGPGSINMVGNAYGNTAASFINVDAGVNALISATITGIGLDKLGSGTLNLSGANTYGGLTDIQAGLVNISSNTALGTTAAGTVVQAGAALGLSNNITVTGEALTLNGTGAGAGALRNNSGNNTWTGATITLASDSRINSNSSALGDLLTISGAGDIVGAFGLTVGGVGNTTISKIIATGAGTLTKDGTGTLTLSGVNTYTGLTTVSLGALINNGTIAGSLVNASDTVAASTTNNGVIAGTVANQAAGTFTNNATGTTGAFTNAGTATSAGTVASLVNNAGTFGNTGTITGRATVNGGTITNNGTVSGGATVNGGVFNNGGTVNSGATVNGGTLNTTGTLNGGLTNAASTLASGTINGGVTNTGLFTVTGPLNNGGGDFTNNNPGRLAFSGAFAFTNIGTFTNSSTLANAVVVPAGATLSAATIRNLAGTFSNAGTVNASGSVTNAAGATFLNSGSLFAPSTNSFTNAGTTTNTGRFETGRLINSGTFNTSNSLIVTTDLANSGTVNASGSLTSATVTNTGVFNVVGNLGGSVGSFGNQGGGVLNLTGGNFTGLGAFNNAGALNSSGARTLGATTFNNQSTGTISQVNGATTDQLTIGGGYVGSAGSRIVGDLDLSRLDAGAGRGDRVIVTGAASGTTNVDFNIVNTNRVAFTTPIDVFTVAPGSSVSVNQREIDRRGFFGYFLRESAPGSGAYQVVSQFNSGPVSGVLSGVNGVISSLQSGFHQPASAIVSRPDSCQPNQFMGGPFVRMNRGETTLESKSNGDAAGGGAPFSAASKSQTQFSGIQGGFDLGICNIGASGWNIHGGVMGGYVKTTTSSLANSPSPVAGGAPQFTRVQADVEVPFFGLYSFITNGPFTLELNVRKDLYDTKITSFDANTTVPFVNRNTKLSGSGLNYNAQAQYRFNFERFYIEPLVGISRGTTRFGALALATGASDNLLFNDSNSVLGRVGVNVGTAMQVTEKLILVPFAHVSVWKEFEKSTKARAVFGSVGQSFDVQTDRVGEFGQVGLGVQFRLLDSPWLGFIRGDVRFGDKTDGKALNAGVRAQF